MFEEVMYDYLKEEVTREPASEDPYWWEVDEIVYITDDEDELDWSDDTLDCGCCACCGCSCYDLDEEGYEEDYTFYSELPYIYMSLYFNHTLGEDLAENPPREPVVELDGCWGDYDYNEEDFDCIFSELPNFLASRLGYGSFECLIQADVEYNMSVGSEETDWNANCYFELIDWRKLNA